MKTLRGLAGFVGMLVGLMLFVVGCEGIERTNGNPVRVKIDKSPNANVYIDTKAGDQSGDMPKAVPVTPSLNASASQSGAATSTQTPSVTTPEATK